MLGPRGLSRAFRVAPDVLSALTSGGPVVALESTLICHGMPYPSNLTTATALERAVRDAGAVPATVAVKDGSLCVGLRKEELEALAAAGADAVKVSRRDLSLCVARQQLGATTVAGTLVAAAAIGIKVFATGGIGGVHRDVQTSMDVSADLIELGRSPVVVVCSGVKSILDIRRTLEVLETQGVTVATLGSDEFPAFFTAHSGVASPARVDSLDEIADIAAASMDLGLQSGILLAVPPDTSSVVSADEIEAATATALNEAAQGCVQGRSVTPFVLSRVASLTRGASLNVNISNVCKNADVGARVAVALSARLRSREGTATKSRQFSTSARSGELPLTSNRGSVVIVGGCMLDIMCHARKGQELVMQTSNPGTVYQRFGGVARNVAETVGRLGGFPKLLSVVGDDQTGTSMMSSLEVCGVDVSLVQVARSMRTPVLVGVLDSHGSLLVGVADMDSLSFPRDFAERIPKEGASYVVADANLPPSLLRSVAEVTASLGVPFIYETTSALKANRIVECGALHLTTVMTPNAIELEAVAKALCGRADLRDEECAKAENDEALVFEHGRVPVSPQEHDKGVPLGHDGDDVMAESEFDLSVLASAQDVLAAMCGVQLGDVDVVNSSVGATIEGMKHVLVTLGANGVLWMRGCPPGTAEFDAGAAQAMDYFPAAAVLPKFDFSICPAVDVVPVDAQGAGDTFLGGFVWALSCGWDAEAAIQAGIAAASETVQCDSTVAPTLSPDVIQTLVRAMRKARK